MSKKPIRGLNRRVLLIGAVQSLDSMEAHVLDALGELGVDGMFVATGTYLGDGNRLAERVAQKVTHTLMREPERLFENRLVQAASDFDPDLVLVILGNQLSPKTMRKLRGATRAPIVAWCQDAVTSFGRQYLLGAGYDCVFLKDRHLVDLFSRMIKRTPFRYLPEACNPLVHRSVSLSDEDLAAYGCEIMVAGSLYYYRQEILESLRDFKVRIWGHTESWFVNRVPQFHMQRPVYGQEKAKAACAANIALNTLHFAEIDSLNCRAFELAGCGAFQLISNQTVLREHFVPGSEVETFDNADELVEKVRFYLQNLSLAREIGAAGQRRAFADHTYQHRLKTIFGEMRIGPQ